MTGGCVFTGVCPSTLAGGGREVPHSQVWPVGGGGVSHFRSQRGEVPHSQVWMGGTPFRGLAWGVPHLRSGWGVPTSQVRTEGYPHPGVPSRQDWMGYPPAPSKTMGYPFPIQDWMGYSLPPLSRNQSSIASTCYTAGSIPLAFTQEDFLVSRIYGTSQQQFKFCFNRL